MIDRHDAPWKELGLANWARDCGFEMTKHHRRYNLWRANARVLTGVDLEEIERYLEKL